MTDINKITARFWSKVDTSGGENACWPWLASKLSSGYGVFGLEGKSYGAHRVAVALDGRDPESMYVCHTCDNKLCCNPVHLFLGTPKDNTQDARLKGRLATGVRQGAHTKPESRRVGSKHGCAKLTETDVLSIRASSLGVKVLARQYSVDVTSIQNIMARRTWRHI